MKKNILVIIGIIICSYFISFNTVKAEVKKCVYARSSDSNDRLTMEFDFSAGRFHNMTSNGWIQKDYTFYTIGEAPFLKAPLDYTFPNSGDTSASLADQIRKAQACPKYIFDFSVYIWIVKITCNNHTYSTVAEVQQALQTEDMSECKIEYDAEGTWQRMGEILHARTYATEYRAYVLNEDLLNVSKKDEYITYATKLDSSEGVNGSLHAIKFKDAFDERNMTWVYKEKESTVKKSFKLKFLCKKDTEFVNSKTKSAIKTVSDDKIKTKAGKKALRSLTLSQLNYLYKKYCKSDNKTYKCKQIYSAYQYRKDLMNNWCSQILDHRSSQSACLNRCLDMPYEIADFYIETRKDKVYKCNVSAKVISIVYNFLKWLKYIAPVLVIIFSMLDFIKALAAQDDEAMKKAQQKFIKRLISAALLFLLPLIIDYILRIFGLYNSQCDITDIF